MSKKIFPKIMLFTLVLGLILPLFSFAQEKPPIEAPKTIEEGKELVEKGSRKVIETIPGTIKKIWKEEVLPVWGKMWNWFKGIWKVHIQPFFSNFWYSTIKPRIKSLIQRVKGFIGIKIEEQKPIIREEIEKEAEEMKEELPKATKSLWQRFKELLE